MNLESTNSFKCSHHNNTTIIPNFQLKYYRGNENESFFTQIWTKINMPIVVSVEIIEYFRAAGHPDSICKFSP